MMFVLGVVISFEVVMASPVFPVEELWPVCFRSSCILVSTYYHMIIVANHLVCSQYCGAKVLYHVHFCPENL